MYSNVISMSILQPLVAIFAAQFVELRIILRFIIKINI